MRHPTLPTHLQATNMVQWYPGHIAKAERDLKDQLKAVDIVLEVRGGGSSAHANLLAPAPLRLVAHRRDH